MRILIVRHGEAVDDAGKLGDKARWLTPKGRRRTRIVSDFLAGRGSGEPAADGARIRDAAAKGEFRPTLIWTSPLVRAVQTAEILALAVNIDAVEVDADIMPEGNVRALAKRLRAVEGPGPMAVVGHEPGLSELARELLGADVALPLNKSGVIAIDLSPPGADAGATKHGDGKHRGELVFHLRPKDMSLTTGDTAQPQAERQDD